MAIKPARPDRITGRFIDVIRALGRDGVGVSHFGGGRSTRRLDVVASPRSYSSKRSSGIRRDAEVITAGRHRRPTVPTV